MKSRIWLGLLLALFTGHAWGATNSGQSVVFIPGVQNGTCSTWPTCPAVPNDATHLFYFAPGTGVTFTLGGSLPAYASTPTFNLGTLNGAALDSSLQQIFGLMPGKNGDGGALAHTTNGALETGGNLATVANAQGAQGAGSTFNPPAGGSGILGYLSGIYKAITGTLTVGLPSNAAQETGGNLASAAANTGTTATNTGAAAAAAGTTADAAYSGSGSTTLIAALKGVYAKLAGTLTTVDQNGAAFGSAVTLTAGGASDSAGRSLEMLVTVAGNVSLQLSSGSAHIISVAASPYTQTFPYAVTAINSSGTTATATYANLH